MKTIELTQGKVALVDDVDFEELSKYKWCASKAQNLFYATRTSSSKKIRMHTMLMKTPKGMEVDHIDGNGLNNQRENLRVASRSENSRNIGKSRSNTSGFKGVVWHVKGNKWQAQIRTSGKTQYLGLFSSKELAYEAYCKACVKYHGEFARLK